MLSSELRDMIIQCVDAAISIEQLEDWLVPRLPILLESIDSDDSDVVAAITLGLAELSDGVITEDEFRQSLLEVLQEYPEGLINYSLDQFLVTTSSSSQNLSAVEQFPVNDESIVTILGR